MKQTVEHKKLSTLPGVLLILGLVAALAVLDILCVRILARWIGAQPAALAFWILGGLIALWMLHVYVVKYVYELNLDVLRLNRSYGKRPRHIEDIYLRQIVFVGTPEEAKRRHPRARRVSAVRRGAELPVTAVVYKSSDGEHVALIQANSELRQKLEETVRNKKR